MKQKIDSLQEKLVFLAGSRNLLCGGKNTALGCWLGLVFFFYMAIILVFSPKQLKHDEPRYFTGAHHLTQGYFVTRDHPDFTNGPGYPLLLTPVMALLNFDFDRLVRDPVDFEYYLPGKDGGYERNLKWRLLPLRLMNAFLLAAGFFVIYQAACLLVSTRTAFVIAILLALNPFQLRFVAYLMTENVTPLFIGSFAWFYILGLREKPFRWKWILLAGLAFAMLALTRTLFGYVALAGLLAVPVLCFIEGRRKAIAAATLPFAVGLLFCTPYLAYTYHYTGKPFCWATNGGELLYWITSPGEEEYGSWLQEKWIVKDPLLSKNHLEFVRSVDRLPVAEREEAWMRGVKKHLEAENIVPALIRNYVANVCRIFFNDPRTRRFESFPKLVWNLAGAVILVSLLAALIPTLLRWRRFPFELKLLLLCAGIYFGGILILPAEPRYLIPIFPILFIWVGYVFEKLLRIDIQLKD